MPLNGEDVAKPLFGTFLGLLGLAVAWLTKLVVGNREDMIAANLEIKTLKGEIVALKEEVAEVKKEQLTVECIREVVETAFDRRDAQNSQRRAEWDKTNKLEMQHIVQQELERAIPRIVREVKGTTGVQKRPSGEGRAP